ncbi:hypothetical protein AS9A_2309 [Hoyosella subflava DQS3-9A1]|uniref:Uncharacterized protein n=1 Tax=Hoyosella subflava (strain DSM 45089 / JCM 17490 / NBRC 109087 / DQS3-9A1) TaxID=443218 RepID=F6ERU1_HOYSD|nr:hypothetical protein AS9A_2309 [Hoyosella subflava DQS3-9A1]
MELAIIAECVMRRTNLKPNNISPAKTPTAAVLEALVQQAHGIADFTGM